MFSALRRWVGRGTRNRHDPHDPHDGDGRRWVVLDCESSGLDPERDRLLSIAAVAVHVRGTGLHIVPADSFEMVLQQPEQGTPPDKANILVHGIGIGAQRAGVAPAIALQAFRAYANGAPLIGYHVSFDRRLLERAERAERAELSVLSVRSVLSEFSNGKRAPRRQWLDLAELAPVLRPDVPGKALDHWLAAYGIRCLARHQAAADALATAELLLCLWPLVRSQTHGRPDFKALQRMAAARRWLGA